LSRKHTDYGYPGMGVAMWRGGSRGIRLKQTRMSISSVCVSEAAFFIDTNENQVRVGKKPTAENIRGQREIDECFTRY